MKFKINFHKIKENFRKRFYNSFIKITMNYQGGGEGGGLSKSGGYCEKLMGKF